MEYAEIIQCRLKLTAIFQVFEPELKEVTRINVFMSLLTGSFVLSEDAQFESKLDEANLIRAKEELNENAKDRICAVQSFRNLILQENWLKTPTGTCT